MSTIVRRLLSLAVVAVVVAVGVVVYRGGDEPEQVDQSDPGRAQALDPNPDLALMKAKVGVRPCVPGSGGGALPSVTLSCLGGGDAVDLSTLRGPMVISFWASWCVPCAKEMPVLQAFDRAHGSEVPVVGINFLDRYPASALDTMREAGATYPSLTDPTGVLQEQSDFAKFSHLPILVFLDAKGRISFEYPGGVDSEDELTDLVRTHLGVDL